MLKFNTNLRLSFLTSIDLILILLTIYKPYVDKLIRIFDIKYVYS